MNLHIGQPLTLGPTLSVAPDHLRMCSVLYWHGVYYLYCDYVPAGNKFAPGSYSTSLHLFQSKDLINWEHHGEIVSKTLPQESFGVVNIDVWSENGWIYLFYTGIGGRAPSVSDDSRYFGWNEPPDHPSYLTTHIMVARSSHPAGPFTEKKALFSTGSRGAFDHWKVLDPHVTRMGGKFLLYYKGFDSAQRRDRRIGLASSDSPFGHFTKHEHNPILDLSPVTGLEMPLVFRQGKGLGMLLSTFTPRGHTQWLSPDGLHWRRANNHFHHGYDVGLVKDSENNLLPYIFQCDGSNGSDQPLYLRGYHLQGDF